MHHHTEHRWTLLPLQGRIVPIPGWEALREPTTKAQARAWIAEGWRLGLLLEGLTAVTTLGPAAEELAAQLLPNTCARWGSTRLYNARSLPIPTMGMVEARGTKILPLPDDRVWAPANAPKLEQNIRELQASAIIGQHPDHREAAWMAVATRWPEHDLVRLSGAHHAAPPGADSWRELRILIGASADQLRSVVFRGQIAAKSVTPLAVLVDAFRAVMKELGCRTLYTRGIHSEYPATDAVLALRAAIREVGRLDTTDELSSRGIGYVFRQACKGALCVVRKAKRYRLWAVDDAFSAA